jgi:YD repeat-containing protein
MAMEAAPGAASAIKDVAGAAKMVYDADGRLSEIRQAG